MWREGEEHQDERAEGEEDFGVVDTGVRRGVEGIENPERYERKEERNDEECM